MPSDVVNAIKTGCGKVELVGLNRQILVALIKCGSQAQLLQVQE